MTDKQNYTLLAIGASAIAVSGLAIYYYWPKPKEDWGDYKFELKMIDKKIKTVQVDGHEVIDFDHFIKVTKVIYRSYEIRLKGCREHFYSQRADSYQ